jgi:hypothetical protein
MPYPRRYFPFPHLSYRWFATRGWALGAALIFGFSCPLLVVYTGWVEEALIRTAFGVAALALFLSSLWPERLGARLFAVGAAVGASLGRATTIIFVSTLPDGTLWAGVALWTWTAYACWLLATFTAKVPTRASH